MLKRLLKSEPRNEAAVDAAVSVFPADEAVEAGEPSVLEPVVPPELEGQVTLPVLGTAPVEKHQRALFALLALSILSFVALVIWALLQTQSANRQSAAAGQALIQSQRLAKSVVQATSGSAPAFADVAESAAILTRNTKALEAGDSELGVSALGSSHESMLEPLSALVERAQRNADVVGKQKDSLTKMSEALQGVQRNTSALLEQAESVVSAKLQQGAPVGEIAAASQLTMLTQRIGKSASEFQSSEGASPEAVFLLGKDLNTFKEIATGLLDGSADLRLAPARDAQMRERLQTLVRQYENTLKEGSAVLSNIKGISVAREAQVSILTDSEALRKGMETLQDSLGERTWVSWPIALGIVLTLLLVMLSGWSLVWLQLTDSRERQRSAEKLQQDAKNQEMDAKRLNDANQAAILRLMNELQSVAEGDLTQEATVSEDITGAIADSVNYTVEELRLLVGSVQNTASRVAQTTASVDQNSTELLAASTEQMREIRETGQSILDMATRINQVSAQAQESAAVARQSLSAAKTGLQAVENSIDGMNSIRNQIQETAKRIKRLGESSQEIGEITDLISDITEQTNVLALNAAIQAASAGEAGRGFSVVAEEVQRLAERSGDATRQISALVKAIQTDTQDAVAAMERSTQGVVEGAKLSDSAGTALAEIDRVSRRLAELIEHISHSASSEAAQANEVAENIQHIFAVSEQTSDGTRTTAQKVRELSQIAEELRQSVARFKIV
ncbi:MAG: methyl-accepting chemotaxis protein [Comamonas sp.]